MNQKTRLILAALVAGATFAQARKEIVHDADYYVLEAQHAEQWKVDDQAIDQKLAAFRETNDGKPPNILYILIDDMGFGDMGIPELNAIRGYKTPAINKFSVLFNGSHKSKFPLVLNEVSDWPVSPTCYFPDEGFSDVSVFRYRAGFARPRALDFVFFQARVRPPSTPVRSQSHWLLRRHWQSQHRGKSPVGSGNLFSLMTSFCGVPPSTGLLGC